MQLFSRLRAANHSSSDCASAIANNPPFLFGLFSFRLSQLLQRLALCCSTCTCCRKGEYKSNDHLALPCPSLVRLASLPFLSGLLPSKLSCNLIALQCQMCSDVPCCAQLPAVDQRARASPRTCTSFAPSTNQNLLWQGGPARLCDGRTCVGLSGAGHLNHFGARFRSVSSLRGATCLLGTQ